MFENIVSFEKRCNEDKLISDRLFMQESIFDFEQLTTLHFNDETVEEMLRLLISLDTITSNTLKDILMNGNLIRKWISITQYLKFENCGDCINHAILSFQFATKILYTVPNSIYLFFIPINEEINSCPIINLILSLNKLVYNDEQSLFGHDKLLSLIESINTKNINEDSDQLDRENSNILLLTNSLEFLKTVLITLDDLSFVFDADFKSTEHFLISMNYILNSFNPLFQTITSSKLIIKQNLDKATHQNLSCLNELRIIIFKILERLVPVTYGTNMLNKFICKLDLELLRDQGTLFETFMDILSPDFPSWFTKNHCGQLRQKCFIYSLQLQYNILAFLLTLCNHWDSSSIINMFLSVKKYHISLDELPDFISKSNFWFSDVKDKFSFDKEKSIFTRNQETNESLPHYCNSIFSTLFYKVVSLALHNGFKLQQNTTDFSEIQDSINNNIVGEKTLGMKKLYELKIDIFLVNIRIISCIFASAIKISDKDISNKQLKENNPFYEVITSFSTYLIWICEFVFDYKYKISQLYHVLEEVNIIKLRLPILFNIFNVDENKPDNQNSS